MSEQSKNHSKKLRLKETRVIVRRRRCGAVRVSTEKVECDSKSDQPEAPATT